MHGLSVLLFSVGKTDCYNSRVASKVTYAADPEECGGARFSLLFLEHSEFWVDGEIIRFINEPDPWPITAAIHSNTNVCRG